MNPIIIIFIIILAIMFMTPIIFIFSTKTRNKVVSNMIKGQKELLKSSKDDMKDILTELGSISAEAQKNIIDKNEETLKYNANKSADINKSAVETTARAFKKGFTEDEDIFCKHCGNKIDTDSKFCKKCGKEQ